MHRFPIAISIAIAFFCAVELNAQVWQELTPDQGSSPAPRRGSSAVYDPVDHRMIIFGGRTAPADVNDIWAFDLGTQLWTDLTPQAGSGPGGRFESDVIYDPVGHRVIVYNGQGIFTFFNDVWSFDLTSGTWSEITTMGTQPNVRYGSGVVFDPQARDLVTFAGFTNQGRFGDTWRLDVDSGQWTEILANPSPGRRCLHTAAYDPLRHRMLSYGGQRSGPLGDLWEFDLAQDQWNELTPANSPDGRFFPVMVYDSVFERALIFGGQTNGGRVNETWIHWSRLNFYELVQAQGTPPSARQGSAAIYIESERRMIVFGGTSGSLQNDVWSLDFSVSDPAVIRAGNVNARVGAVADVLLVNGGVGSEPERRVDITPSQPFEVRVDAPPMESGPVGFVLYGYTGIPDASTARPLPGGIGWTAMPIPFFGGTPGVIWNSLGADPVLGAATRPSPMAPAVLFSSSRGLRTTGDFFFQGIIQDRGALRRRAAVTNGIWVQSR